MGFTFMTKLLRLSNFFLSTLLLLCTIPSLVEGATYYVAKNGSDGNSCTRAQSSSTPKVSIAAGIACMSGGDTLIIGNGVYNESIDDTIPSGSSDSVTVVRAASANGVVLRPRGYPSWGSFIGVISLYYRNYITIDGLAADATSMEEAYFLLNSSHIVLQNGTASNGQGIFGSGIELKNSSDNEVRNMDIRDNGIGVFAHGIYSSGANNILEGNRVYRNSGFGIHVYPSHATYNIIRGNEVYQNGFGSVYIVSGRGNAFYDNRMYSNGNVQLTGGDEE
jgi:parallel beta-helix repeat protein